jgi:hypothetical protein
MKSFSVKVVGIQNQGNLKDKKRRRQVASELDWKWQG